MDINNLNQLIDSVFQYVTPTSLLAYIGCIIIVKPEGIKLADAIYEECWDVNDDGVGIAYVDPEKKDLVVDKGYMKKEQAIAAIKHIEERHLLIHFRRVSRGIKSEANCHPFLVRSLVDDETKVPMYSFAIAHNGTIDVTTTGQQSDTAAFIEKILGPQLERDPYLLEYYHGNKLVEMAVGTRNKLVALRYEHATGKVDTFWINKNGQSTNERHGCWFSNYSWLPIAKGFQGHGYGGEDWENGGARWHGGHNGYGAGFNGGGVKNGYPQNGSMHNFPKSGNAFQGGGTPPPLPGQQETIRQEYMEDHLGWRWDGLKNMFVNRLTGAVANELTYRKAFDLDYEYKGQMYTRTSMVVDKNGKPLDKPVEVPRHIPKSDKGSEDKTPLALPGAPDKPIEVPRDEGVIGDEPAITGEQLELLRRQAQQERMEDEWDKECELAHGLDTCNLSHLSRREKKELRRRCSEYVNQFVGGDALKQMNQSEIIKWVRMSYVEAYPKAKTKGIEFIDRCLINGSFCKFGECDIWPAMEEKSINIEIGGE